MNTIRCKCCGEIQEDDICIMCEENADITAKQFAKILKDDCKRYGMKLDEYYDLVIDRLDKEI